MTLLHRMHISNGQQSAFINLTEEEYRNQLDHLPIESKKIQSRWFSLLFPIYPLQEELRNIPYLKKNLLLPHLITLPIRIITALPYTLLRSKKEKNVVYSFLKEKKIPEMLLKVDCLQITFSKAETAYSLSHTLHEFPCFHFSEQSYTHVCT